MPKVLKRGIVVGPKTLMVGECRNCKSIIEARRNEFKGPDGGCESMHIVCPVCHWAIPQTKCKAKLGEVK